MILSGDPQFRLRSEAQSQSRTGQVPGRPTILLGTIDPQIRQKMGELLQGYAINTLWATGIEEVRSALSQEDVMACFCGFWLVDGTYRDVVRHLKHQRADVPMIIICAPECPQEYRDYLAALNIRAFDFICYPYRRIDLERILNTAVALRKAPLRPATSVTHSSDRSFDISGLRRAS
jgi:DNA-binding NtrC family response regulator